ncbi:MAG: serine hydrolase domain-containing protein [Gammaproteobacteria bacterium]
MSRHDRIAQVAARYTGGRKFSGIEWHVEHGGQVLASGRSGHADALAGTPLPDGAIYRIYSMTKPIVSVLALMLMEAGKLRLFDPVSVYNPAFANMMVLEANGTLRPAVRPILVEDLITHRAGFTYEFITGCHIAPLYQQHGISSDGQCSLDTMMERLAALPLAFQPGTRFRYSVAVDVLAHVCERATGERLDVLLKQYLFDPLGMCDTAFHVPTEQRARLLPMFGVSDISEFAPLVPTPQELKYANVDEMYPADRPDFRRGGHGLFSTLSDYAQFARMLITGKTTHGETLLGRKTLEMMRANRIPADQLPLTIGMNALPGYGWGLGVRVMMDVGQAMALTGAGELGWAGAASTYFFVDPHEDFFGVFMTQYLGAMLPLAEEMRTAAYQMLP